MMEYLPCCLLSRSLLCNLVRVKLGCYELEGKNTLSLEDYLKAFMETEVKPLWPKGWMQARCVSFYSNYLLQCVSSTITGKTAAHMMFTCLLNSKFPPREHLLYWYF